MEDKEQRIKIEFETNADQVANKVDGLTEATSKTSDAQLSASSNSKKLAQDLRSLDSPINGTITGFKAMLKQMWLIVANPLGLILAAIVLAVVGLVAVFRTFQPLVDKLEQGLAALGAVFNVIKNTIFDVFTGTKSLGEAFGGLSDDMSTAANRTMALVKAQQDLEDVLSSQEVQSARTRSEINKLNVQAKNRTLSEVERLNLLDKAGKLEQLDFNQRVKNANEEVRIAREAIAIKAKFSKAEIKILKEQGLGAKELAESKNGNFDDEFKNLAEAQKRRISLEDESTSNLEKNQNKRDKLEDDQNEKQEKVLSEQKARSEKLKAIRDKEASEVKARNDKLLADRLQFEKENNATIALATTAKIEREALEFIAEQDAQKIRLDAITANVDEIETVKLESAKRTAEQDIEIEKAKQQQKEEIQARSLDLASRAVGFLSQIFGKNKKVQKAAMIAEGAISIGKQVAANNAANIGALATPQAILSSGASAVPIIALNNVSTGIGIASTIASTATALKSLGGGGGGLSAGSGGGSRGGSAGSSATPQVSFQASSENQIGNTLANNVNEQKPIQAYVVSKDVTTAQNLDNNKITSNSI